MADMDTFYLSPQCSNPSCLPPARDPVDSPIPTVGIQVRAGHRHRQRKTATVKEREPNGYRRQDLSIDDPTGTDGRDNGQPAPADHGRRERSHHHGAVPGGVL